jgi:hypothetical protein
LRTAGVVRGGANCVRRGRRESRPWGDDGERGAGDDRGVFTALLAPHMGTAGATAPGLWFLVFPLFWIAVVAFVAWQFGRARWSRVGPRVGGRRD